MLHRFDDEGTTGAKPASELVRGSDGLYYGTTSSGATGGVIFRLNIASETPPGTHIQGQPVDPVTGTAPVNLSFGEITDAGETTVTISASGGLPPADFVLGDPPPNFDIVTTATFAGDIQVCISYSGLTLTDPATASLFTTTAPTWPTSRPRAISRRSSSAVSSRRCRGS